MKKILLLFALLIPALAMTAADNHSKIEFEKTSHDFGTISADGGKVSCAYKFTNTGNAPLVIISVTNGGCGCTTPSFPKEPVQPGKSGEIVIHFDPEARKGEFNREVRVRTNGTPKRVSLKFSGVIIPK